MEHVSVDVLIAGGGVAGLRAALVAADEGCSVLLVQRGPASSQFLHAVNAAFQSGPRGNLPQAVFDDMMLAGGFVNNPALVALCAHGAEEQARYFDSIGVPFIKEEGRFALRQAAGSRSPHTIFTEGSAGAAMMVEMRKRLTGREGVTVLNSASLLKLTKGARGCAGGFVWDEEARRWLRVSAKSVVLATGGASSLYSFTTQFEVNQGEGYAMALEAGAELVDMEFVCFEPFSLTNPAFGRKGLATTLLKEGAVIRNRLMETFIDTSVPLGKDVISRAIHRELMEGRGAAGVVGPSVFYDLRGVPENVMAGYPDILRRLTNIGLEHATALIPVAPAFHYLCGGVRVDGECRSSIPGLFAAGEACGGVHGAHRIAGGAGNDVMVTGARVGKTAAAYARGVTTTSGLEGPLPATADLEALRSPSETENAVLQQVRHAMDTGAGIRRDAGSLRKVLDEIGRASCRERVSNFV
jgi:aspartate oxidase